MHKLDILVELAPLLTDLVYKQDIMVAVTDTSGYLYYSKAITLDAKISFKQKFLDYDLFGVMKDKKSSVRQISPPEYGDPFQAIGCPIFDENNELLGMLGFGTRLDNNVTTLIQGLLKVDRFLLDCAQNWGGLSRNHFVLNTICQICGKYGNEKTCVTCPVEIRRQQDILKETFKLLNLKVQNKTSNSF